MEELKKVLQSDWTCQGPALRWDTIYMEIFFVSYVRRYMQDANARYLSWKRAKGLVDKGFKSA